MNDIIISVVVITYNKLDYLKAVLLNFALHVKKNNTEIIIVNDGSTDQTSEFLEQRDIELDYKYINIKHSGSAKARNTGISMAQGDYILFVDNDILLESSFIENLRISINRYPHRIHAGKLRLIPLDKITMAMEIVINQKSEHLSNFLNDNSYQDAIYAALDIAFSQGNDLDIACWWALATGGNICFPKNVLYEINLFDENFKSWGPEDIDLCYRAFIKGYFLKYNDNCFLYHLDHPRDIVALRYSLAKNITQLYKKYKTKDILAYLNFFNGMISLDKLNKICIREHKLTTEVDLSDYHIGLDYYLSKDQMIKWKNDGDNGKI